MPLYDFKDREGNLRELYMNMSEAPESGVWVDIEGEELMMLPPVGTGIKINDRPFESISLEPYHPDAEKFNEHGQPVFETKRDRVEFLARNKANPNTDNVVWNA